jgi:MFS family permease
MPDLDAEQPITFYGVSGHESEFYVSLRRDDGTGVIHRIPASIRPVVLLAFANSVADAALLPLLPAIRDDLGLTGAETGAILAATTVTLLVATIPVGQFAARVGSRPLLILAAALVPVSLAAFAAAPTLGVLVAARIAFGLSFAITWSVGAAVATSRVRGAAGSAAILAISGLGWLVGPLVSGLLAGATSWRLPLAVGAIASVPLVLPFLRGASDAPVQPVRLRARR